MGTCNNDQLTFAVFILNNFAAYIGKPVTEVYKLMSEFKILDEYIIEHYDVLHTLGKEYLMEDLAEIMADRGGLKQ